VKGPDQPVAVRVGIGIPPLLLKHIPLRVRIARNVHPVPRPALPEPRRRQHRIHPPLPRILRTIRHKFLNVLPARRHPMQQHRRPLQQHRPRRFTRRQNPPGQQALRHQTVERVPAPSGQLVRQFLRRRNRRHLHLLERPVPPPRFLPHRLPATLRPRHPVPQPLLNRRDRLAGQLLPLARHRLHPLLMPQRLEYPARPHIVQIHHRSIVSAPHPSLPPVQPQPVVLLLRPMTAETMLRQHRPHLRLEKSQTLVGRSHPHQQHHRQHRQQYPRNPIT
jgi:hypothetical protein